MVLASPPSIGRGRARGLPLSLQQYRVGSLSSVSHCVVNNINSSSTETAITVPSESITDLQRPSSPSRSDADSNYSLETKGTSLFPALFKTRPDHITNKRGESGTRIECYTNCIGIQTLPSWCIYQYHLRFVPIIDNKTYRIKMVKSANHLHIFGEDPVFDGTIMYSANRIDFKYHILQSRHPLSGEAVEIRIKFVKELGINDHQCLTVFNLCNRKAFEALGYVSVARNFYNYADKKLIPRFDLEVWPGYMSAIRAHEDKLLLCCETSHKVSRTDTVLDFLQDIYRRYPAVFHEKAIQLLIGTSVLTKYNNRTYRVDDIKWDAHPTDTFEMQDGKRMSYEEYYFSQYGITIRDLQQPLLVSFSKKHGGLGSMANSQSDFCLIPELCVMTGLTDQMRENRNLMQELSTFTRVTPEKRVSNGRVYLQDIRKNPEANKIFNAWNLHLENDLLKVDARRLNPEEIVFGGAPGQKPYRSNDSDPADWGRRCRQNTLLDPVELNRWVMVFAETNTSAAEKLFLTLKSLGPRMGVYVSEPTLIRLVSSGVGDFLQGIQDGKCKLPNARIMMIIVPDDNKARYDAIKKKCCLDSPIPSQVMKAQSVEKNTESVCTKILIQMNCKVGGSPWTVLIPTKDFMVVGYDAYHDSANKTMCVGAAVFSLDSTLTRWFNRVALHKDGNQLVSNLTAFCREGLRQYANRNGTYPSKVFLFRDGVGEGQIPVVCKEELPRVREAFKELNPSIKVAFIIVTKRTSLRFFQKQGERFLNPYPGTVIDNGVTKPERYDFYLIAQSVRHGTVMPTCYNVIYDDTNWKPDWLQQLAFKLCHLYYNWQGTVRVPAPCQYAHKLAFLVAQSLHSPAHDALADKLFYL